MTDYLSPDKLKLMHTGMTFDMLDIELAALISQASAIVDSYCNVPLVPADSSFLGGTATEEHAWPFPDSVLGAGKRRLYPFHWPVKSITSMQIIVDEGAAAPIPSNALVINNTERWVEITSLTIASNSGLFTPSGWLTIMGGLQVPLAQIILAYGWDIAEISDRCWAINNTNLVFASTHEHWIQDATAPVIYVNGVAASPQPTIDYLEGRVTFASAQTGRVTATYRHKLPRNIPLATGLIVAAELGESNLRAKDLQGLETVRDDSIEISRQRRLPQRLGVSADNLELTVPSAALLLGGYRHWRIA